MKHYDMKAYQKKIKHEMDEGRYQHTLGVMYTCAALAMRYEYDIQKAELAGLLHDCAKNVPNDKKLELCKKQSISKSRTLSAKTHFCCTQRSAPGSPKKSMT